MTCQPFSRRSPQAGPDQAGRGRPWLARTVYGVLIIEIALVIWYAVAYRQVDFRVYMWGGHNVSRGTLLYLGKASGHWFTYPPFAAVLFAPISVLPVILAQVLWELASVAAFAIACATTLKLAGWRATRTTVAAVLAAGLLLEPVYHTLLQGQINLILLALVLADVWRVSRNRPAGIGVGIAAAIKLTPAIFVLLFLLAKRPRAALTAADHLHRVRTGRIPRRARRVTALLDARLLRDEPDRRPLHRQPVPVRRGDPDLRRCR